MAEPETGRMALDKRGGQGGNEIAPASVASAGKKSGTAQTTSRRSPSRSSAWSTIPVRSPPARR